MSLYNQLIIHIGIEIQFTYFITIFNITQCCTSYKQVNKITNSAINSIGLDYLVRPYCIIIRQPQRHKTSYNTYNKNEYHILVYAYDYKDL